MFTSLGTSLGTSFGASLGTSFAEWSVEMTVVSSFTSPGTTSVEMTGVSLDNASVEMTVVSSGTTSVEMTVVSSDNTSVEILVVSSDNTSVEMTGTSSFVERINTLSCDSSGEVPVKMFVERNVEIWYSSPSSISIFFLGKCTILILTLSILFKKIIIVCVSLFYNIFTTFYGKLNRR